MSFQLMSWLGHWIPNPGVLDSKPLGGSKVNSSFHHSNQGWINEYQELPGKWKNGFVDVKYLCCYYVIYHNWKVPGENFLLLTSRTCRFIFYVELSSLWTVNNTIFCLFRFLYISYGQQITQYFISYFILHQLGTLNNAVFCFAFSLLYFAARKISSLCAC